MHGGRKMALGTIRSVYTVADDMDLLQAFYAGKIGEQPWPGGFSYSPHTL